MSNLPPDSGLTIQFADLTVETFLQQYWQRKPLLIKGGFAEFEDFLAPDELAGLAAEPNVESRLIYRKNQQWHAETGPFESYSHLGDQDWSLVVQAADNWAPVLNDLLEAFDFLPDWRRDDVMLSFAVPGGSVGPHIDNYDTFICQGSGERHWRVGDKLGQKQFSAHEMLLHVEAFDAIIDAELEAGDILYIPPGYPHEGIALSPSMSFSVGYRTASAKDTLSALADYLIDHDLGNNLLEDPARPANHKAGHINNDDLARIRSHLSTVLSDDALLADFVACHMSEPKHALDAPEEPFDYTESEVVGLLQQQPLIRLGGLRCHYTDHSISEGRFYLNGESCQLSPELAESIRYLCDNTVITGAGLANALDDQGFRHLVNHICPTGLLVL